MIRISGGHFPQRSGTEGRQLAFAQRRVESFEIAARAVTRGEWRTVMGTVPDPAPDPGPDADPPGTLSDEHPVINVSWYDATNFIERLNETSGTNFRLPSELEWEYAARTGVTEDCISDLEALNYNHKRSGPVPVGSLSANAWNLHEMLGNVWEWVAEPDGDAYYTFGLGHDDSDIGVLRGGCWASRGDEVELSARAVQERCLTGWDTFGFRLARDVQQRGSRTHAD